MECDSWYSSVNLVIDAINGMTSGLRKALGDAAGWVGFNIDIPGIPHITIPKFETGGYVPSRYTMFMAGENGVPEIAGTVGGKTAVAGGVAIPGIKDAISTTAEAQMRMMQQEIDLLKQLLAKETSVNIGDRDIARANLRGQKAMGLQIIT